MSRENKKKKMKLKVKIMIALIVLIVILLIAIGGVMLFIKSKLDKIQRVDLSGEDLGITEEVAETLSKYRNIAIFGVDSQADDYGRGNRSDCIMVASINNETGDIKLFSVYRDTYAKIDGYGLDKINHAYSFGEAPLAIKTLNTNFDLNIQDFVTVNFDSVSDAVDALGGITLPITSEETKYINGYIDSVAKVTKKQANHITTAGTYTLDGVQAVAYGRIRYTYGGDYKRTERMRTVLEAMLNKLKKRSVGDILAFADEIFPHVYTNMGMSDIIELAPKLSKFNIEESIGWPYKTQGTMIGGVFYGIPVTLESNVITMHQEIFGEEDYEPSDTVKSISQSIITKSGVGQ